MKRLVFIMMILLMADLLPLFRQQTLRASLTRAHCALGRELGAGAVRVHGPIPMTLAAVIQF